MVYVAFIAYFNARPRKLQKGNVFSNVCLPVCLSTGGFHVTMTNGALDFTVQPPLPVQDPVPLLVTSGGQNWIPVERCLLHALTVQAQPTAVIP